VVLGISQPDSELHVLGEKGAMIAKYAAMPHQPDFDHLKSRMKFSYALKSKL
jgi:hypothetical protein